MTPSLPFITLSVHQLICGSAQSINQSVSIWLRDCHRKGAGFTASDQSQTGTSLMSAEHLKTIAADKDEEVRDVIQNNVA